MENWLYANSTVLMKVTISVVVIFIVVLIITRISGLRTFAKMSSLDFASTIAIGSILASTAIGLNQSLLKGSIALAAIITFQSMFSLAVRKSKFLKSILTNKPVLLMRDGEILRENLKKTNIGEEDLIAKLREANVLNYEQVHAVVLESTGDMSVLHGTDERFEPQLLKGVKTDN